MKKFLPILFIIAIAAFFRFYRLPSVPPSLSHDEVAIGYNAYSILKTGKDEYGVTFPLLFRSFDDYKLPGMVYATVPTIAIFGLNELGVRFPSAFFGTLAVLVLYGIARELTRRQTIPWGAFPVDVALVVSFVLAISAWHINFSRQSFESNGSLFFFMLGLYFLLRASKKIHFFLYGLLAFVLSLYFYYSVRLVIPFVLLGYFIIYRAYLIKHLRFVSLAIVVAFIAFSPMMQSMLTKGGFERIKIVSVVNDATFAERKSQFATRYASHPTLINKVLYNQKTALLLTIAENYGKNLTPLHLLTTGTGTYGLLHGTEALFFLVGIVYLVFLKNSDRWLILIWAGTSFLPGALSVDQPNALRTLVAAPVFALFSGLGVSYVIRIIPQKKRGFVLALFFIILLYTLQQFSHAYFTVNSQKNALGFGDGHKQMITYVATHEQNYDMIIISGYYWRPYIYTLFWKGYDPRSYQTMGSRDHFGRYYFTSAEWDTSGISMYKDDFRAATFPPGQSGHKLFVLATPEYERHKDQFRFIDTIDGIFAKEVYVAAELR